MPNFERLSHAALQHEMLSRLSEIANLRKDSMYHDWQLKRIRSRLNTLDFEVEKIKERLKPIEDSHVASSTSPKDEAETAPKQ